MPAQCLHHVARYNMPLYMLCTRYLRIQVLELHLVQNRPSKLMGRAVSPHIPSPGFPIQQ